MLSNSGVQRYAGLAVLLCLLTLAGVDASAQEQSEGQEKFASAETAVLTLIAADPDSDEYTLIG